MEIIKKKKKSKDSKLKSIFTQELYFPNFVNRTTIEQNKNIFEVEVDMSEFEERKKKLKAYIEKRKKKTSYETKKQKIEQEKEKIDKGLQIDEDKIEQKDDSKKKNDEKQKELTKEYKNFINKLNYFKRYKSVLTSIFFQDLNDNDIIDRIQFIYYYMLFEISTKGKVPEKKFLNCFIKNSQGEIEIFDKEFKLANKIDYNKYTIKNILTDIEIPEVFFDKIENPFMNNYLYYSFPTLFRKSFLQYDEIIYKEFLDFLRFIYKSTLAKDIYYLCPVFNDFEYPLINDDILDEMFKNTYYIPCESDNFHGYTQKNLLSIFIPTIFKIPQSNKIENFINRLSFILNTTIHEQLKHYLRALLFYNSFRFNNKINIESDLDLTNEENEYLDGLASKEKNLNGLDGGHRAEILLYGEVLKNISTIQGIKMFYYSTWNTSIEEHFSNFKINYGTTFDNQYLDLKDILENDKNNEICPFFKHIIKKFLEINNIKGHSIPLDLMFSSNKLDDEDEEDEEKEEGNKKFMINLNYKEYYERNISTKDCDP